MNPVTPNSAGKYTNASLYHLIYYGIVLFAALNAVLRPSLNVPITPYYILAPLIFFVFVSQIAWARQWFLWFFVFACYGLLMGTLYGVPLMMQLAQLLKYAQLITFLALLTWLCRSDHFGKFRLQKIAYLLTFLVFVIAAIQIITGFEFPTVVNEESSLWLNTFFFTPNDLALFLSGVTCLVLCSKTNFLNKVLFLIALFALNIRNDAKAAVLAACLIIGMYTMLSLCFKLRIRPIVAVLFLTTIVIVMFASLGDTTINIKETEFDFIQLFLDPFERIINLEPYDLGGSIFDRTDALIYSVEALRSTWWLGLGPAGTIYTLSLPNTELLTAKSLHNAIAEVIVEFGPASLIIGYLLSKPLLKALFTTSPTNQQMALISFAVAAPLLSVSQSSGYISNYAFWLTAFLIWLAPSISPAKMHIKPVTAVAASK